MGARVNAIQKGALFFQQTTHLLMKLIDEFLGKIASGCA
jgi:hypothetical protein